MEIVQDTISWLLILGGAAFLLIGGLGLVRLPDFYTRIHAAGITDTMASELLLVALMVQAGFSLVTVKLIIIGLFLFFTSPTATHAVANAAFVAGLKPYFAPKPSAPAQEKTSEEKAGEEKIGEEKGVAGAPSGPVVQAEKGAESSN